MNIKNLIRSLCFIGLAATVSTSANASPVLFEGHHYEFITFTSNWAGARIDAGNQTFGGATGYLANVTSLAENQFLVTLGTSGFIGGSDALAGTDPLEEGKWCWADGPEAGLQFWDSGSVGEFTSWNGLEPNNLGGEDFLDLQGGNWNDVSASTTRAGYFVEYDVPEPSNYRWPYLCRAPMPLQKVRTWGKSRRYSRDRP